MESPPVHDRGSTPLCDTKIIFKEYKLDYDIFKLLTSFLDLAEGNRIKLLGLLQQIFFKNIYFTEAFITILQGKYVYNSKSRFFLQ